MGNIGEIILGQRIKGLGYIEFDISIKFPNGDTELDPITYVSLVLNREFWACEKNFPVLASRYITKLWNRVVSTVMM